MTLKELACEYFREEEKLDRQITAQREALRRSVGVARYEANRRLMCLYEMRREVHSTAVLLDTYYDKRYDGRIYHKKTPQF
jgi:hypothetical protein